MGRPEQQREWHMGPTAGSSAAAGIAMAPVPLQLPDCKGTYMLISLLLWSALPILIPLSHIQMYALSFVIIIWF